MYLFLCLNLCVEETLVSQWTRFHSPVRQLHVQSPFICPALWPTFSKTLLKSRKILIWFSVIRVCALLLLRVWVGGRRVSAGLCGVERCIRFRFKTKVYKSVSRCFWLLSGGVMKAILLDSLLLVKASLCCLCQTVFFLLLLVLQRCVWQLALFI